MECASGTYSKVGQANCSPCDLGNYCPTNKTGYPVPCTLGLYADVTGLSVCMDCPAGYKCENTSTSPVPCESGTYSLANRSECKQCPAGKRFVY